MNFRTICLASAGLLLPSLAVAAGLGRLTVQSALGEPLRAEVEVVSVQPGDAESLAARIASQAAFKQANIELNGALYDIRFNLERRPNGQYVIVMASAKPMNEPFLDMLLELNWAGGRLIREYTFLLDPPEYRGAAVATPAVPIAPPGVKPLAAEPGPAPLPEAAAAKPAPAGAPAAPEAGALTYEVKRGDTLAKIARSHMPAGVSLQQMLVALYSSNQDAFIGKNMNRLRAGRILDIPDRDAALSVQQADARRVVNAQSADYAEYQRSIGAAVAATAARPEAGRQAAGRITEAAPDKPAAPAEPPRDQLRLSKPDDAKAAGKAARAAGADDATAKDKALTDAQERIALLERNILELKKLQELKSASGAQLQQQAEAAKKGAAAPKAEAQKDAGKAAEPAAKTQAPQADAGKAPPVVTAEAAKAGAAEAGRAPDIAKAAPEAPKAAPKAAAKAAPPPEPPSLLDELLDSVYALAGIALVVVLLIGYAVFAWRRKKKASEQRFGTSSLGALSAERSAALAGGRSVDTGSSELTDFSQGAAKADADEIDPVAEADVYMAYGRDAQAEEILKEALAKDSTRLAVHLKLLEVYANRKDSRAFETAAREVQTHTGGKGPDWEKVVALGQQIDPANPLYGGAGGKSAAVAAAAAAAEPSTAPPVDFDLDLGGTPAPAQPDINLDASAGATAEQPLSIDFDLDLGGEKPPAEKQGDFSPDSTVVLSPAAKKGDFSGDSTIVLSPGTAAAVTPPPVPAPEAAPAESTGSIDFDLGLGGDQPVTVPEQPATERVEPTLVHDPAATSVIDFDFNLDDAPAPAPAAAPPASAVSPDFDLTAITLDLGTETSEPAPGVDSKWQEVATKLDLAKAYEEMGDKDGARDLLNEVMKEGDSAQQQQAKSMLEALA